MFDTALNHPCEAMLDRPVAAAFASTWAAHSRRRGTAIALREDIGRFAVLGGRSDNDLADFTALVQSRDEPVIVLQAADIIMPRTLSIVATARCVQMMPVIPVNAAHDGEFLTLGAADRDDMLALATLTEPGPFARNTYLLGDFIGIRVDGILVAMAGQRMGLPGWTEISAVCVHPDFRGRSMARQLMIAMMHRIALSGQTPFLHSYADNVAAIRLYEQLGFDIRREMNVAVIGSS